MNMISFCGNIKAERFKHNMDLFAEKIFKLKLDQEKIIHIFKENNFLKIAQKNGSYILIDHFFNQNYQSKLIIETTAGIFLMLKLGKLNHQGLFKKIKFIKENASTENADQTQPLLNCLNTSSVGIGGSQRLSMLNLIG